MDFHKSILVLPLAAGQPWIILVKIINKNEAYLYSKKYKTLSMILSIYEIMFGRRTNGTGTLYFQNYFEFSQTFTSILITLDFPARQLTLLSH